MSTFMIPGSAFDGITALGTAPPAAGYYEVSLVEIENKSSDKFGARRFHVQLPNGFKMFDFVHLPWDMDNNGTSVQVPGLSEKQVRGRLATRTKRSRPLRASTMTGSSPARPVVRALWSSSQVSAVSRVPSAQSRAGLPSQLTRLSRAVTLSPLSATITRPLRLLRRLTPTRATWRCLLLQLRWLLLRLMVSAHLRSQRPFRLRLLLPSRS